MKCAIVGCGVISRTHAAGFQQIPGAELAVCCDLIPERAQAVAQEYNIPAVTTDYKTILNDPEISAISVCTDHASHADIVCDALNAGKHVICEKVPGRTPEDLTRMVATAKAHPELVASGIFQHRFAPGNIVLRDLIREHRFGKLLTVNLNFCCLRTDEYYQKDAWRGTVAGEGGGVLINQAIHFLDQLRFLFGDVKNVSARCANLTHQGVIETEDTAAFTAEFANGLFVTANATNSAFARWRSALTITGTEVQIEFINEKLSFLDGKDPENTADIRNRLEAVDHDGKIIGKNYYGTGHTAQLADFIAAITEKRAPEVPLADAANSAALVHAVYAAGLSGKWEPVTNYL